MSRTILKIFALLVILVAGAPGSPAQPEAAPESAGPVIRAVVCTEVVEREPVGEASAFEAGVELLFCFTEITGLKGATITHAWIHDGKTRARVELLVRSPRWRTWSSKKLAPGWTGSWQVKILDAEGIVLSTVSFEVE
jgi:hypothetical protein